MRVCCLVALLLPLAACASQSASTAATKSAPTPVPYGTPCSNPCTVRVVNQTRMPLTVLAASADGTRVVGTVAGEQESAFAESMLAPSYMASPDAAHGDAVVTCLPQAPRPGETMLLVCK